METTDKKVTCFIFGEEACEAWYFYTGAADKFLPLLEQEGVTYELFYFVEGETSPAELLYAYDGWKDYSILPEPVYRHKLTKSN